MSYRIVIYPLVVLVASVFLYLNSLNQEYHEANFRGLPITVEFRKGEVKSGTDVFGKDWEKVMKHHYGCFDGIMGADGKELDFYMNPNAISDKIFRVTQLNVKTGEFDEYKIMLNFESITDAFTGYLQNYPPDWKGYGGIEEITLKELINE